MIKRSRFHGSAQSSRAHFLTWRWKTKFSVGKLRGPGIAWFYAAIARIYTEITHIYAATGNCFVVRILLWIFCRDSDACAPHSSTTKQWNHTSGSFKYLPWVLFALKLLQSLHHQAVETWYCLAGKMIQQIQERRNLHNYAAELPADVFWEKRRFRRSRYMSDIDRRNCVR